ncbi:MAG: flippase-like domain-containing protein [Flavobacteriales bacterium]|nr:flippase-like domain-containing protein [Flavobacteriales bacterium]
MKQLIKVAKVVVPIGLAIYLMYITFKDPQQRAELLEALGRAEYIWVLISMFLGWCSHMLRARRWKYLIEPLGYKTRLWNAYHAVMSGYLINMAIPRAGEISRAGLFSKSEHTPFDRTFGTIAAERVVDLVILLAITGFTVLTQYDIIWEAMQTQFSNRPVAEESTWWPKALGAGILLVLVIVLIKRFGLVDKLKGFLLGIWDGLLSIWTTPYKVQFFRDTALIWILYVGMFAVMYQCLEETSGLGLGAVMAGFVFGSFAVVLTPGGTGAYHLAVAFALGYYGIAESTGQALGLIIWGSQALMLIVLGFLSLLLMPIYNREYTGHTTIPTAQTP